MSTAVTGSQCRQEAEQARAVAGKGTRPVPGAIHHRDPPQSIPCGNTYPGNVMFCSNPPPLCYKTTGPPSRFPRHDHPPHALKQPRSLPGWGGGGQHSVGYADVRRPSHGRTAASRLARSCASRRSTSVASARARVTSTVVRRGWVRRQRPPGRGQVARPAGWTWGWGGEGAAAKPQGGMARPKGLVQPAHSWVSLSTFPLCHHAVDFARFWPTTPLGGIPET